MKIFKNDILNESCIYKEHESGLKILIAEKPEFNSAYALFGTRYGSVDTTFKTDNGEFLTVPAGIAHFLEHKLFESEDGDAITKFSKFGASANAYTSFDKTCYLFSCSDNFKESFETLLDFVRKPYFTLESVLKEQGIIEQEIMMYDDAAPWRLFTSLRECLYHNHPIKLDIAGTVQSIAEINADLLYDCYNTFYNLNNMFICVAGNVSANEVLALIDKNLKTDKKIEIIREPLSEPETIVKDYAELSLPVAKPLFALGFKEKCRTPQKTIKQRLCMTIILDIICGNASPLYKRLFDENLINENFGAEYFFGHNYASVIFEGESSEPLKVKAAIIDEIHAVMKTGVDKTAFERAVKKLYGYSVMMYNSVESIASHLTSCVFLNEGVFDEFECLRNLTIDDVNEHLRNSLDKNNCAMSVVKP